MVDETVALDAFEKEMKKCLNKVQWMVVDIFHNDTLQRTRFYDSPFLTKRK